MPPFVVGLLIAAIFAAAQPTISSSLNSISASVLQSTLSNASSEKVWGLNDTKLNFARSALSSLQVFSVLECHHKFNCFESKSTYGFILVCNWIIRGVPLAGVFAVGIFTKRNEYIWCYFVD